VPEPSSSEPRSPVHESRLRRALVVAARAVWDFVGGSTPELPIGVAVVLGVVAGLVAAGSPLAAGVLGPLLVVGLLMVSLRRATRVRKGPSPS